MASLGLNELKISEVFMLHQNSTVMCYCMIQRKISIKFKKFSLQKCLKLFHYKAAIWMLYVVWNSCPKLNFTVKFYPILSLKMVRAITHYPFKLRSPNLHQMCKTTWLRALVFLGVISGLLHGPDGFSLNPLRVYWSRQPATKGYSAFNIVLVLSDIILKG